MTRTDYDLWRCAKCNSERRQPSVPHNPPSCCGTGMWFISFLVGRSYEVPDVELEYHRLRRGD